MHQADGQWNWTNESYPADAVSLRSVSSDNFVVVDHTHGERVIGETDFTSGPSTLHEKAIYILEGAAVSRWNASTSTAARLIVRCGRLRLLHDAISYTKVTILEMFETGSRMQGSAAPKIRIARAKRSMLFRIPDPRPRIPTSRRLAPGESHGEVHVVSRVVGFKKIKFYTNENVGSGDLDLPEQQMHTSSYWLTVPAAIMTTLPFAGDDRRDGVVGLAFAMKNIAQLLLMCDGHDIGLSVDGGSLDRSTRTGGMRQACRMRSPTEPNIFIYDNYPGGIGFSRPLFEMHDSAARADARPDRRMPVRLRLSVVRRTGRQYRSTCQAGRVAHSRARWPRREAA